MTFTLRITRVSSNKLNLVVTDIDQSQTIMTKELSGVNSGRVLYVGFSVGHGILHYISPQQVIPKIYFSLSFYQQGLKKYFGQGVVYAQTNLDTVIPLTSGETTTRYTSVKYTSPAGDDVNKIGLRIYQIAYGKGVYPFYLVSKANQNSGAFERCFWYPFDPNGCIGFALMQGRTAIYIRIYQEGGNTSGNLVSGTHDAIMDACKIPYSATLCVIPRVGYMTNVELKQRGILLNNFFPVADFDGLRDDQKDFYAVHNEAGIKYLFSCHYECGTCDLSMKCLTCPNGASPVNGRCPETGCSSITDCVKCAGSGQCRWCENNLLQPKNGANDACQATCDATYVQRADYPHECVKCVSDRCDQCTPIDTCTQCKAGHSKIDTVHASKLPAGITVYGKIDCLLPSSITEWLWDDGAQFQPCLTNCRKCTDGTTCTLCGDHTDPSKAFFLRDGSSLHVCELTDCVASLYRYNVPGYNCLQCTSTTYLEEGSTPPTCIQCILSQAKWIDPSDRVCKDCPTQCSLCTSMNDCQGCKDSSHFLGTDKVTCSGVCQAREYKDTQAKKCKDCPQNCSQCDETNGCTVCDKGFFVEGGVCKACKPHCEDCRSLTDCVSCKANAFKEANGECKLCPNQCGTCNSITDCTSCSDPLHFLHKDKITCSLNCKDREFADPVTKKCKSCTDDCSICDVSGCSKCDPNLALVDKTCKKASLVDYSLKQFYDPESSWTFNVKIILQDYPEVTDNLYQEFEKSILNYTNKFKVTLKDTGEELSLNVTNTGQKNQFWMRVDLPQIEKPKVKIGQKYKLSVQSYSESLDPNFISKTGFYNLRQKLTTNFEVEVLKVSNKPLDSTAMGSIADFSMAAGGGSTSSEVSEGTGIVIMVLSGDQSGVIMKFSQYLKLIKRVKLIGEFLGISLQAFVEALSGGKEKKDFTQKREAENQETSRRRALEISLKENQQLKIEEASNGSQNKLDRFVISVFFEGPFMVKTVLYHLSWVLKLIGVIILSKMKNSGKAVKWKLNYLKYQRKVHFMLAMSGIMDLFFFSTRILLHRKNSGLGWLVKTVCALNLSLMTLDLMQMVMISLTVKYEPKSKTSSDTRLSHQGPDVEPRKENKISGKNSNFTQRERINKEEIQIDRSRIQPKAKSRTSTKKSINLFGPETPKSQQKLKNENLKIFSRTTAKKTKSNQRPRIMNPGQSEQRDDQKFYHNQNKPRPYRPVMNRSRKGFKKLFNSSRRHYDLKGLEPKSQIQKVDKTKGPELEHIFRSARNNNLIKGGSTRPRDQNMKKKKIFINHRKTIRYNSRDLEIENFAKALLVDNPKAYESSLCLLNNCFSVIHMAIFQILIPALPHAPEVLLFLLVVLETVFVVLTLVPLLFTFRFLPWIEISEKILRFVFMAGFFSICFIISLGGEGEKHPVNKTLQSYGMLVLLIGIATNYLTTFIKALVMIVKSIKAFFKKKKSKKKTEEEKLYEEQRGLIFYNESEDNQDPEREGRDRIGSAAFLDDDEDEDIEQEGQANEEEDGGGKEHEKGYSRGDEKDEHSADIFDFLDVDNKAAKTDDFGLIPLQKDRTGPSMLDYKLSIPLENTSKREDHDKQNSVKSKKEQKTGLRKLERVDSRAALKNNRKIDNYPQTMKGSFRGQNRGLISSNNNSRHWGRLKYF